MADRSTEGSAGRRKVFEIVEPDPPKLYRHLRVIEYIGSLDWVLGQVRNRQVKTMKKIPGQGIIIENFIGEPSPVLTVQSIDPKDTNDDSFNPNPH